MNGDVEVEEELEEETEFVKGDSEIKPIPHDQTLTGWQIVPRGSRLLVRIVPKGERKTPQGIILPGEDESELQEVQVLAIGQGRYNQDTGHFMGSNYGVGDRGWMNHSAPHLMTEIPGRRGYFLIQEDLLQALLVQVGDDLFDPFLETSPSVGEPTGETDVDEDEELGAQDSES